MGSPEPFPSRVVPAARRPRRLDGNKENRPILYPPCSPPNLFLQPAAGINPCSPADGLPAPSHPRETPAALSPLGSFGVGMGDILVLSKILKRLRCGGNKGFLVHAL